MQQILKHAYSMVYLFVRIITMTVSVLMNSLATHGLRCVGGYEATSRDALTLSNAIIRIQAYQSMIIM